MGFIETLCIDYEDYAKNSHIKGFSSFLLYSPKHIPVLNVNIDYFISCEPLSPIYANHFFARQFFILECKTVANYVSAHENEDWALKFIYLFTLELNFYYNVKHNNSNELLPHLYGLVIDASGVVGAGLAKGNYQFMGDFDECLDVKVTLEGDQKIHGITGQYCTLNLPMEAVVGRRSSKNQALDIESLHLTPTIVSLNTGINVSVSDCTDSNDNPIQWYHTLIL
ncbi:unnamed protein product [Oppiella nova]|uniref:Nose resistant-to-fluoxetine protein N-terminal domain-containing protein n=1 Tax=Oppiella nova TaxID=334625 RepID=A0A7R9MAM3_9ACAR|nr:unnamed protein product [Oppiella nova]CAG2173782.1 unnamed protein product [Oppiella nova]